MASGAKAALAGWRAEVSDEECESLTKGKRLDEIARTWCEYCRLEADPALIEAAIRLRIIELISREGKAIEGVYDVMTYFREAGYRIALATSSSYEIVHAVLEKLSIGHYFEVICSADDERYGKPHPAVYLCAAKIRLAASQCIVIEDSQSGYRAALSAGLKTPSSRQRAIMPALTMPVAGMRLCMRCWKRLPFQPRKRVS